MCVEGCGDVGVCVWRGVVMWVYMRLCVEGCGDVGVHETVCVEGCGDVGVCVWRGVVMWVCGCGGVW